jgi:hypothetical protein
VAGSFDLEELSIDIRPSRRGGVGYHFPAGRNFWLGLVTVLAALGCFAGTVYLFWEGGRAFEAYLFALFTLVLGGLALKEWFVKTHVVIEEGLVRVIDSIFGIPWTPMARCNMVTKVDIDLSSEIKLEGAKSGLEYYNIEVHLIGGRTLTAGRDVKGREQAEWIAEQMVLQIAACRGTTLAEASVVSLK